MRFSFNYDDGDRCTASLTFDSTNSGTATSTCDDGSSVEYDWRLIDIPTGGDDTAETRYNVGDVITTLPTGIWFPDRLSGSVRFRFVDGKADIRSKTPGSIGQVSADRAYDTGSCYEAVLQHDAIVTILPRRNARCSRDSHPPPWRAMRDTHLRRIRTQGRYVWRKSSGCTRQSVAENAVSRYKAILGVSLSARTVKNQKVEAAIKCAVLNRMAELGMPRSERVY